jgi:hypothetical protein
VCLTRHCLVSNERKMGGNCSWHDFLSSILSGGISALCLYGAIQLCTKTMARFLASSESSLSPKQMEFRGNFLSKWNFLGISFGRLLARIAEYLLNRSTREVKFYTAAAAGTTIAIAILAGRLVVMLFSCNVSIWVAMVSKNAAI